MVTTLRPTDPAAARVWDIAAQVPDPEVPVLTIEDLGVLRSAAVGSDGVRVVLTPTYSGCPAIDQMRGQEPVGQVRGRIVNLTSVDAFKAHPQNAHYAATKAAVVSLTRSFAHHVAPDGILVNSVAPAGMATDKARQFGILEELATASPLNRGAQPSEIAEWVLMTGGPKNTYMTGENVIVSGGYIYA